MGCDNSNKEAMRKETDQLISQSRCQIISHFDVPRKTLIQRLGWKKIEQLIRELPYGMKQVRIEGI